MTLTWCYNEQAKRAKANEYRRKLRAVANTLRLNKTQYDIRWNAGGIAVWGEVTLHSDTLYVQASAGHDLGVLVRTCQGRKDYTGGPNRWFPFAWLDNPEQFANKLKTIAN